MLGYMAMIPYQKYMAVACLAMGVSALVQNGIRALVLLSLPSSGLNGILIYYGVTAGIMLSAAMCYFIEKSNEFSVYFGKSLAPNKPLTFSGRMKKLWKDSSRPFSKAFPMLFQLFFSMFVTFVVFPGVTCAPSVEFISSYAWYSLAMVSFFNLFDTLGRFAGGAPSL